MKHIGTILFFILGIAAISSCSTSSTIFVNGVPGEEIYTTKGEQLGVVPDNGRLELKLPEERYYALLLSKNPETGLVVPFGLDYKSKSSKGARILSATGFCVLAVGGLPLLAVDGEEEIGPAAVAGTVMMAGGAVLGGTLNKRLGQAAYEYQFRLLKEQRTNSEPE